MHDEKKSRRSTIEEQLLATATPIDQADDQSGPLDPMEIESDDSGSASRLDAVAQRRPHEDHWDRKPNVTGKGAIHVKTFVCKFRPDAFEFLDEQVNTWLDTHPEYEVKFVTTAVGKMLSKSTEDALIVNVWV